MDMWQRFKDWWLGGDPTDVNWMQDLDVVGWGPFPLFHERKRMQDARRHSRELCNIAQGIPGPVVSDPDIARTADMLMPGWLARELPPGSLVAFEEDLRADTAGRFRLYNGTWVPSIENDHKQYRILYLAESAPIVR